jgi:hypothetical protein
LTDRVKGSETCHQGSLLPDNRHVPCCLGGMPACTSMRGHTRQCRPSFLPCQEHVHSGEACNTASFFGDRPSRTCAGSSWGRRCVCTRRRCRWLKPAKSMACAPCLGRWALLPNLQCPCWRHHERGCLRLAVSGHLRLNSGQWLAGKGAAEGPDSHQPVQWAPSPYCLCIHCHRCTLTQFVLWRLAALWTSC